MVREKCTLGRVWGLPQESFSVPLSKHSHSSMFTGRQELSLPLLNCNWKRKLEGSFPLLPVD